MTSFISDGVTVSLSEDFDHTDERHVLAAQVPPCPPVALPSPSTSIATLPPDVSISISFNESVLLEDTRDAAAAVDAVAAAARPEENDLTSSSLATLSPLPPQVPPQPPRALVGDDDYATRYRFHPAGGPLASPAAEVEPPSLALSWELA